MSRGWKAGISAMPSELGRKAERTETSPGHPAYLARMPAGIPRLSARTPLLRSESL